MLLLSVSTRPCEVEVLCKRGSCMLSLSAKHVGAGTQARAHAHKRTRCKLVAGLVSACPLESSQAHLSLSLFSISLLSLFSRSLSFTSLLSPPPLLSQFQIIDRGRGRGRDTDTDTETQRQTETDIHTHIQTEIERSVLQQRTPRFGGRTAFTSHLRESLPRTL